MKHLKGVKQGPNTAKAPRQQQLNNALEHYSKEGKSKDNKKTTAWAVG